jgi:hypothetical protein
MRTTTEPRAMTARYRGKCRTCAGAIAPGDPISYDGRNARHAGECTDNRGEQTWKQRYGRCEDAPCCGCC